MNSYEEKLERRRDRLENRADAAEAKSKAAFGSADRIAGMIPMGQPILVGHHSEKRHRRDIAKIDRGMRVGIDESKKAENLRRRVAGVGSGGVSSDDPEAVVKLKEKLAKMEDERDRMKALNKAFRKGSYEELAKCKGMTPEVISKLKASREDANYPITDNKLFESYVFTNLGGNIRRVKGRIEELLREAVTPEAETVEGDGFTTFEDKDENRTGFEFDGKPEKAVRTLLKSRGFRWAPSVGRWQRQLNNSGRYAVSCVVKELSNG